MPIPKVDLCQSLPFLEKSAAFFRPHHQELRKRLLWSIVAIVICSGVAYLFAEQLTLFLVAPLVNSSPLVERLVYTNLPEAFIAYLKVALFTGFIVSMPMSIYQIWAFVAPGLRKNEKYAIRILVGSSTLLFICGAIFAYAIALPYMLHYFMSYASETLRPLPKFGNYLGFVARMILTFGLAFEIPFAMIATTKSGIVQVDYFRKNRFYFYVALTVFAFLLAAGDLMATILLGFPLAILYEVGIWGGALLKRKKHKATKYNY